MAVTVEAGVRAVGKQGKTAVLLGNDVLDLKRTGVVCREKPTVFAGVAGTDPDRHNH